MTFASASQFHVFLPWGQRPIKSESGSSRFQPGEGPRIVQLHRLIVHSTSQQSAVMARTGCHVTTATDTIVVRSQSFQNKDMTITKQTKGQKVNVNSPRVLFVRMVLV